MRLMKIHESIVVGGGRERLEDYSIFGNYTIIDSGEFPGGPVVRTPHSGVQSLIRELGSCKPRGVAKIIF